MKFEKYFAEVQSFSDDSFVVSGEYSKEQARAMFESIAEEEIDIEDVTMDYVRFGFPPEFVEGYEEHIGSIWYTGASGKGAKKVWVYK